MNDSDSDTDCRYVGQSRCVPIGGTNQSTHHGVNQSWRASHRLSILHISMNKLIIHLFERDHWQIRHLHTGARSQARADHEVSIRDHVSST
jgi:hypothetical protein